MCTGGCPCHRCEGVSARSGMEARVPNFQQRQTLTGKKYRRALIRTALSPKKANTFEMELSQVVPLCTGTSGTSGTIVFSAPVSRYSNITNIFLAREDVQDIYSMIVNGSVIQVTS